MSKPIFSDAANPQAMLRKLASSLEAKGQIDKVGSFLFGEVVRVKFGSVSKLDKLISRFGAQHLNSRREAAFNEIRQLINRSKVSNGEQLLCNIRTVMEQKGRLKGKDVAAEIRHFLSASPAKIAAGGPVVPTANSPISYLQVSPLRVVADHKVVRSSTLVSGCEGKPERHALAQSINRQLEGIQERRNGEQDPRGAGEFFSVNDPFFPAGAISVMADIGLTGPGYQSQFITVDDLKTMYREMFAGLSGTVAVEPFADCAERKNPATNPSYTHGEKHLRALQQAMKDAVEAAKKDNKELKFVIATEDAEVYRMLKEVAQSSDSPKAPGRFQT